MRNNVRHHACFLSLSNCKLALDANAQEQSRKSVRYACFIKRDMRVLDSYDMDEDVSNVADNDIPAVISAIKAD